MQKKHNVDVMLGGEYYNYDEFQFEAKTQNSPIDDIPTLNVGAKQTYTSTTRTAYRILSGFGRINYNYDMKYLFSFVARYDGISRLKDNRWDSSYWHFGRLECDGRKFLERFKISSDFKLETPYQLWCKR